MTALIIDNDGPEVVATNFWDVPGPAYYLSSNAGAFRLLLRDESALADVGTPSGAAVTRGPWPASRLADAIEVLLDDGTDSPFALHTDVRGLDRVPPDSEAGRRCVLSVWVRGPRKVLELPCTYRRARRLPDLRPWEDA